MDTTFDKYGSVPKGTKSQEGHVRAAAGGHKAGVGAFPAVVGDLFAMLNDEEGIKATADDAARLAGPSGDMAMFEKILGSLGQKKHADYREEIDEEDAVKAHKWIYGHEHDEADEEEADSKDLGTAAAMEALKKVVSGEDEYDGIVPKRGMFLSLAMSEASKLYDDRATNGKLTADTDKPSTVGSAAETALKMWIKSQGQ